MREMFAVFGASYCEIAGTGWQLTVVLHFTGWAQSTDSQVSLPSPLIMFVCFVNARQLVCVSVRCNVGNVNKTVFSYYYK